MKFGLLIQIKVNLLYVKTLKIKDLGSKLKVEEEEPAMQLITSQINIIILCLCTQFTF